MFYAQLMRLFILIDFHIPVSAPPAQLFLKMWNAMVLISPMLELHLIDTLPHQLRILMAPITPTHHQQLLQLRACTPMLNKRWMMPSNHSYERYHRLGLSSWVDHWSCRFMNVEHRNNCLVSCHMKNDWCEFLPHDQFSSSNSHTSVCLCVCVS